MKNIAKIKNNQGFTLIELSIVIIIIGLVIGGILTGQSIIQASKVRTVISDVENIRSSIVNFYGQYSQFPGDMVNATSMFGNKDRNRNPVANGNGDNKIGISQVASSILPNGDNGDPCLFFEAQPFIDSMREAYSVFQHLSLSGYMKSYYNGICGYNRNNLSNLPKSPYNDGFYWIWTYFIDNNTNNYNKYLNHRIFLSSQNTSDYGSRFTTNNPVVRSSDSFAIDLKIDDGKPFTGNVLSWRSSVYGNGCISSWTTADIQRASFSYDLVNNPAKYSNDNTTCFMMFNINNV